MILLLFTVGMLVWVPAPVSYKNVSLQELNAQKVKFLTEKQQIHLVFKYEAHTDTIRSLEEYYQYLKMQTQEKGMKFAELASEEHFSPSPSKNNLVSAEESMTIAEFFASNSSADESMIPEGSFRGADFQDTDLAIEYDQPPLFPTGKRGLEKYIARTKRTPYIAKTRKIEGQVNLRFIVNVDGSISDIRIMKGMGYGCDEEAIRIVEEMPAWMPATKKSKAVAVYEALSIEF
ncbi:MAG: energy transducer TonB [Bacteroidia bacterium]|nr:energy transducer TonB [Bacteroidia bacterium]